MDEMTSREIDELLGRARVGRLCLAGPDGKPYAFPIPFFWDGQALYLRLPLSGRKGEILSVNNQVCFEADIFTDNLDQYASVLIEGRLWEVNNMEEKTRVKGLNDEKYTRLRGNFRPGHGRSTSLEQLPMRKIEVAQISGRKKSAPPRH